MQQSTLLNSSTFTVERYVEGEFLTIEYDVHVAAHRTTAAHINGVDIFP